MVSDFKHSQGLRRWGKRCSLFLLATVMVTTLSLPGERALAEGEESFVPKRAADGKPIFDGKPDHLRPFVNFIMDHDMSTDDLIAFSDTRQPQYDAHNQIVNKRKIKAGYELPLFLDGTDNVQGVYTDFPAFIGIGNSWNSELARDIGNVIGNEKRGSVSIDDSAKALMWSAIGDIRNNPLSGRFEEGLSEDPHMASVLTDAMAAGISGVDLSDDNEDNNFYLKTGLQSKHYAVYNAQWFRMSGSYNVSARALHEYQLPTFLSQIKKGSVVGYMTSYGRTNGVPNGLSPNIDIAKQVAPYSVLLFTDFGAPINVAAGFGNGVDSTYVPDNEHLSALYANVGSVKGVFNYNGSAGYPTKDQTIGGIKRGLFGVDENVLKEAVRPVLEVWVRLGYFNEKDSAGNPIGYPYNDQLKAHLNANDQQSQQLAQQAARESIVLLKNNGTLPLQPDKKVMVMGQFGQIRNKGVYAVSETPEVKGAGLTTAEGITARNGEDRTSVVSGGKIVALKSNSNGTYLTSTSKDDETILETGAVPSVTEKGTSPSTNQGGPSFKLSNQAILSNKEAFEIFDWGQDAFSFQSLNNGKFLTVNDGNITINGTRPDQLNDSIFTYEGPASAKAIRGGAFTGSFTGGFESYALTNGHYLGSKDKSVTATTTVSDYNNLIRKNDLTFKEITLREPGQEAESLASTHDYAIIVAGAPARINAGEGVDRAYLDLGTDQVEMVKRAASAFKKEGKQTIVVINSNFPVAMDDIQDNPDVDSIIFAPYGGQYDGSALTEVLFGDYAPTGRLQSTWYKDISALPKISEYNLPEGSTQFKTLSDIDPRFKVDMENADPMETKLTYKYTDADVTYPFGYGLGYSSFTYSNLRLPTSANGNNTFQVKVDVTNNGDIDTSDVVQLYASIDKSIYGEYVANKHLAAFQKVHIPAHRTQTVTLNIDPNNLAIWDVVRQKLFVEDGTYSFSVGKSSADEHQVLQGKLQVIGDQLQSLSLDKPTNVWDHAFASNDVVYREASKERSMTFAGEYYAVMSTGKDSWVALPNVELNGATTMKLTVASKKGNSLVELREGSPNGRKLATVSFGPTGTTTYQVPSLDGSGAVLSELKYAEVESPITGAVDGTHNLYLVFKNKDIRLDKIQIVR